MIFSARQLHEKCIEQDMGLYQVLIALTKLSDSVTRVALWKIWKKLGCSEFVRMITQFHDKMEVRYNVGVTLSDPISVEFKRFCKIQFLYLIQALLCAIFKTYLKCYCKIHSKQCWSKGEILAPTLFCSVFCNSLSNRFLRGPI